MRARALLPVVLTAALVAGCGSSEDAGQAATSDPTPAPDVPQVPGLVVHASGSGVEETVEGVRDGLEQVGAVATTIDHGAAAEQAGLELDPTVLVVGGDQAAGAAVMVADQEAGLDLPQKFLVWEAEGQVWLGYNSPAFVATRAGLPADSPFLDTLAEDSAVIAAAASGSEEPVSGDPDEAPASGTGPQRVAVTDRTGVAAVVSRLQTAVEAGGLASPLTLDHAEAVGSEGRRIPPTVLTLAGDPAVGTPVMQSAQTMGIDLPLRFLVLEDVQGEVSVLHPDYAALAERHGLASADVTMLQQGAQRLAARAAGAAE